MEKRYAVISYADGKVVPEVLEGFSGHLHIDIDGDWLPSDQRMNDIYREIFDFCSSKSAWMNVPQDIIFYIEDEFLLYEIKDGLYHIFQGRKLEEDWSQFMEWYHEKSISGLDKNVPWGRKQVME